MNNSCTGDFNSIAIVLRCVVGLLVDYARKIALLDGSSLRKASTRLDVVSDVQIKIKNNSETTVENLFTCYWLKERKLK